MPRRIAFLGIIAAACATAIAHFPFLVPEPGGASARLVMSESLEPDSSVDVGILKGITLTLRSADGSATPLELTPGEDWMTTPLPGSGTRIAYGTADLGVMKRGRPHVLIYHPKTIVGDAFDPAAGLGELVPVELVPVRAGGGFRLRLLVAGKPASGMEVRVLAPGVPEADYPTDAEGLTPVFAGAGRYGAWARSWSDERGEREGQTYEQVRRYATLVMDFGDVASPAPSAASAVRTPLPEAVASFGAVSAGDHLYVYGGHKADRHDYTTASVSGRFHRLDLRSPHSRWEELPGGPALQGLNLAEHAGKVYRVGGMEPRNDPGAPEDRHSIADAAVFDPARGAWSPLPPLPVPRSSHDVVAVGDTLVVVGGWWMKGKDAAIEWHNTAELLDLSSASPAWRSIPQPFTRRALAAAVQGGRVLVIGGFDADDEARLTVDILDPATEAWTRGPEIPGPDRNGFGPAACAHDGDVYVSVSTGEMYRLPRGGTAWEPVARTTPRIVHRMVVSGPEILVIGGAANRTMVDLVEAVTLPAP